MSKKGGVGRGKDQPYLFPYTKKHRLTIGFLLPFGLILARKYSLPVSIHLGGYLLPHAQGKACALPLSPYRGGGVALLYLQGSVLIKNSASRHLRSCVHPEDTYC